MCVEYMALLIVDDISKNMDFFRVRAMVLRVVNDQIYYGLKNIDRSSQNLDLWISINYLYQNMMGNKKIYFLNFLSFSFGMFKMIQ
jgi:hypothetical protein